MPLKDLDDLINSCRDDMAGAYLSEAVACYHAGSYRASIVMTWISVVFDIVSKLQELEVLGDKNSRLKLEAFDKICARGDVEALLKFEREILTNARDEFGFVSPLEFDSLERLHLDRHKCAHPSLHSRSEFYVPTAELARAHIVSAVTILLSQPPVQGKAALEALLREVEFQTFPTQPEDAVKHFSFGALKRPKDSLVRNFIIVLLKELLTKPTEVDKRRRLIAAVLAVLAMHRGLGEETVKEHLSKLVRPEDARIPRAMRLIAREPQLWEILDDDVQARMVRYVAKKSPIGSGVIAVAMKIPALAPAVKARVPKLSAAELTILVRRPAPLVKDRAIDLYAESRNFNNANELARELILPVVPSLDKKDVSRIISAAAKNTEIRYSFMWGDVLTAIRAANIISKRTLDNELQKVSLTAPWHTQKTPVDQ